MQGKAEQSTKVNLQLRNKSKYAPEIKNIIKECCLAVLKHENITGNIEISVMLVKNEEIRSLNRDYRNKDAVTDVLSFPMNEVNPDTGGLILGDIVLSTEKAAEQAVEIGNTTEREIAFLTVHSLLHLLGYDHEEEEEENIMRQKQTYIVNGIKFNLAGEG